MLVSCMLTLFLSVSKLEGAEIKLQEALKEERIFEESSSSDEEGKSRVLSICLSYILYVDG